MMKGMKITANLGLFLIVLLFMSCGDTKTASLTETKTEGTGGIGVTLKWQDGVGKAAVPSDVATVRISISGPDMTTITKDFSTSSGGGIIPAVPAGTNRTVSAFGLDSGGNVLYSGYVSGITITGGTTTTVVITMLFTEGAPNASLTADKTSGTAPLSVTFTIGYTDPEAQPGTYLLDYGDGSAKATGSINSGQTVTQAHTYTLNGSFTATLTVTDNVGKQAIATLNIMTGGTPLGGTFFQNKTLTLAESPYLVTGSVQIPAGVTLTIEPGVTLAYAGAYEILIKGNIIANGTASQPITFTTSTSNQSSGATQLRFADTNLTNQQISYVKMEWASKAILTDSGNTMTLTFSNGEFNNTTVTATVGNITISNSTLSKTTAHLSNYNKQCADTLTIQDSTLTDSTTSLDYGSCSNLIVQRCTLTKSTVSGSPDVRSGSVKLLDSSMTDGSFHCGTSATCEVSKNQLTNSTISGYAWGTLTILDTTITYSGSNGILCHDSMYPKNCNISYSKITGNGSGTGIYISSGSISYTEVRDAGVAIKIGSGAPTISNSNFINSVTYAIENRTANSITATNNYWDTTDENVIKQKIFDYYDDINYGIVTYSPFLTSAVAIDTTPPSIPTGLTATAVSKTQIDLSWNASTDNVKVAGYKLYRGGVYLKSVTTTSTSDTGLSSSTQYCYNASAYDSSGNESAQSSQACAITQGQIATNKIAFSSNRDGNYEIYTMNPDGTNQTRLTNNSANDSGPVWSPDGSKIAFYSDRDGNNEIYVMNADGTNPVRLTNNSASDSEPSWSPNGANIAFRTNRDGNDEVYVMNADGTNPVNLTNNFTPYGSGYYYNDFDGEPHWSPDGSKIVFSSWRSGDARVWVMNADGTNPTQLTSISWSGSPRWSPDGSKISYSAWGGLYVMNADGIGSVMLLYNSSGISPTVGSWSPDGTKVVLQSNHSGNYEIYTMNSDGSNLVSLTNNSAYDLAPYWSPY